MLLQRCIFCWMLSFRRVADGDVAVPADLWRPSDACCAHCQPIRSPRAGVDADSSHQTDCMPPAALLRIVGAIGLLTLVKALRYCRFGRWRTYYPHSLCHDMTFIRFTAVRMLHAFKNTLISSGCQPLFRPFAFIPCVAGITLVASLPFTVVTKIQLHTRPTCEREECLPGLKRP